MQNQIENILQQLSEITFRLCTSHLKEGGNVLVHFEIGKNCADPPEQDMLGVKYSKNTNEPCPRCM